MPKPVPDSSGFLDGQNMLAASTLDNLLSGSDSEAALIDGLLRHQLQLGSAATRAAAFLSAYGMDDILNVILALKQYQTSPRGLSQALESASLRKMVAGGVNFNVSGGGVK